MQRSKVVASFLVLVLVLVLSACAGGEGGDNGAAGGGGEEEALTPAGGGEGDDNGAAGSGREEEALTPVTFAISTTALGPAQSPYSCLPEALGYWEEEGLDVEPLGFAGSSAAVLAVEAGQVDTGIGATGAVITAEGAGADLTSFFNQVTRNYLIPHVPEDSPINSIEDFEGKTIGVQSLESGVIPLITAMLDREGVPADSVEFVAIGTGVEALSAVQAGRIDVLGLWDAPHAQIENLGVELRPVSTEFWDEVGFQQVIFATQEQFESQRDVMVGLSRGVAKAMVFAEANPEAAVRLNWECYPESKPSGVPDDVAMQEALAVLKARQKHTQPVEGQFGLATEEQIIQYVEILEESGQIDAALAPEDFWTDELLDEINDFDEEAIREEAESYEFDEEE